MKLTKSRNDLPSKFLWVKLSLAHGKKFGTDAAPNGRAVAFTGREKRVVRLYL